MSRFERTQNMSIDELADYLTDIGADVHCVGHRCPPSQVCSVCAKLWLEEEEAD